MRRFVLFALLMLVWAWTPLNAQVAEAPEEQIPPPASPAAQPAEDYAPDQPEPGSVEKIREHTTAPEFLSAPVSYVPESDTVPSPGDVLGRIVGTPDELSKVAEVHGYFRRLDEASDRVQVRTIGTTEEGREILLALISDPENLASLDRFKDITARLADPRRTSRDEARQLAGEGKVLYHLIGGLHSTETGSPEMLMELAYRLAVSERPEIQEIRRETVVLVTPVMEPDGRDRMVEWYYRHLKGKKLPYEELREFSAPPYWGHYAHHDNNRDGMQRALALTRALHGAYYEFHPQVMHDLHESVPLLYIMTGYGPYNRAIDPVTISEWTQLGFHEAGELAALGLPGVWTFGFFDGWWPGYLTSVANLHHSIGRFYETFGNSLPGTYERDLSESKYLGKPVTDVQWYRPWPPGKKVTWSLRNNTNYMESGVLQALEYAARHRRELLENFWVKGNRALEKGRTEAPYAWAFAPTQRDPGRLAYLVEQLRGQGIEVHRLTAGLTAGGKNWPAGSYIVRMDQPARNAAVNLLEEQKFPADEPNPPYDDVAWTWPLLYGVEGAKVDDRKVLDAPMEPVTTAAEVSPGTVEGTGDTFLLRDTGQNALLQARLLLGAHQVDAAEVTFEAGGVSYPAGSWIVQAPREAVEEIAARLGLSFRATAALPEVRRHVVDLPRVGLLHTWTSTQEAGWARYTLDQEKLPYTSLSDADLRRGGLEERFDVILFPNSGGSFARIVHGIDPKYGPLAYTTTPEFPSHGIPDAAEDITGGMGFEGLGNLQRFVERGGVLVALANAGTLPVDGGMLREVERVPPGGFNTPGSEVRAKLLRPEHPIAYGYEERTSVFRGNGPLWDVDKRHRGLVVVQFGTKKVETGRGEEGRGARGGAERGHRGRGHRRFARGRDRDARGQAEGGRKGGQAAGALRLRARRGCGRRQAGHPRRAGGAGKGDPLRLQPPAPPPQSLGLPIRLQRPAELERPAAVSEPVSPEAPPVLVPNPGRGGAIAVALGILASRLIGFVRDRAIGHFFGIGPHADVWRAALRAPNALQNLLGEGTLSAAFIPIYSRLLKEGREEEAGRFAGAVFGLLLALAGSLALLGVLLARPIVKVLALGFALEEGGAVDRFELTVAAVRIIFPMTAVLVLSAWALGVLNSHRRFFLPYVAPVLWSAAIIAALVWAGGSRPPESLALAGLDRILFAACWGALAGGGLQLLVQLPLVLRLLRGFRISFSTRVEGVPEALRAFGPVLAGRGAVQLSGYLDIFLAGFLAPGAVGVLGYAQNLYMLPVSLFGMSVAAAELPELSRLRASGARGEDTAGTAADLFARVRRSLRQIAFLNVPTLVGYLAFGFLVIGAVYRTGKFEVADNWLTYLVLAGYTLGLLASTSSRLLQNTFYALGDTRVPARIATVRVAASAALAWPLMTWLDRHTVSELFGAADPGRVLHLGAVGLALASGVAAWLELFLLRRALARRSSVAFFPGPEIGRMMLLAGAAALGAGLLWTVLPPAHVALQAALVVGLYAVLYLALARWLAPEDLGFWIGRFGRRLRR